MFQLWNLSRYWALGKFGEHSRGWSCSWRTLRLFHALQTSHVLNILPRNVNQKDNEFQNKICPDNENRVDGNPSDQWETDGKLSASFSWKQDSEDLSQGWIRQASESHDIHSDTCKYLEEYTIIDGAA